MLTKREIEEMEIITTAILERKSEADPSINYTYEEIKDFIFNLTDKELYMLESICAVYSYKFDLYKEQQKN
jgi:hypothetical protein